MYFGMYFSIYIKCTWQNIAEVRHFQMKDAFKIKKK